MPDFWIKFQEGRWWWRTPLKGVLLSLTVFGVCFPYPWLFVRHVQRWQNPEMLIEPEAEGLAPLLDELRLDLVGVETGPDALKVVEKYVYKKVKYAWDWDTWGVVDYIPLVEEVLAAGKEDCDGRAVLAASLLRKLGYQAELVTDMTHVWVKTEHGETMSPGKMKKFVESVDGEVQIHWSALTNVPRSLAYGIAVFPLARELVVLGVLWLLAVTSGMRRWVLALGLLLLLDGLVIVRSALAVPWQPIGEEYWFGFLNVLVGIGVLYGANWHARRVGDRSAGAMTEIEGPPGQIDDLPPPPELT